MGRREQRERFAADVRQDLVEQDLDAFDDELDGIEKRLTARIDSIESAINKRIDQLDSKLGKIMATCVAILTALVGSLVMLALNLATR